MSSTATANGTGDDITPVGSLVQRVPHTVRKAGQRVDTSEIGTSGLRQYGGFVTEEWLRQLSGSRRAWAYREMMDNDPVVGAILFAIRMLAQNASWGVKEGGSAQDAEFIESVMGDMSHTWGDFISEALSMLPYGWAFCETVYKRRLGQRSAGTGDTQAPASSKFTDGKVGWRKLPIRAQETLFKWDFDDNAGLRAMEQLDYHGRHNTIPIEKALLFRASVSRNNPEGKSILRTAYVPWFRLKNIQEIEAIGIERDLAGLPVATPPESVDIFAKQNAQLLERAQELVTTIRRDEDEGVVMPAGWTLTLLSSGGSRQISTDAIVRRYEQRIASSVLADFILVGQDAVGSYAMVDVKADLFGVALDTILDLVCDVLNRYGVPRLLALNGMDISDPPEITHGSTGRINLEKVGSFLNQMALAGAPIPWSEELIKELFTEAGLPVNFDADELAAASAKLEATKAPPVAARVPALPLVPVSKAEQQTGAMVALYPSQAVADAIAQPDGEQASDLHVTLAFLGDAVSISDPDRLKQIVAGWAASTPPLTGQVSGIGHFTAGPEPVTYASVDVPGLPDVREQLTDMLRRGGTPPAGDHGYQPHVTLTYDHRDPALSNHPLAFDHVTVAIAGQQTSFPLTGQLVQKASQPGATHSIRGHAVPVAPILRQRALLLENQFNVDVKRALGQLGDLAARAYAMAVQKADQPTSEQDQLAQRVINGIGLQQWFAKVLQPLLQSHSQRVVQDTLNTLTNKIGLSVNIADPAQQRIIAGGGTKLGLADVEAQVREAILQAIAAGRAEGLGPLTIAQRIRQMVPAGRFTTAGPGYRSQLIARTETMNAQRASSLAAYQAAPNVTAVQLSDGILANSDAECEQRDGDLVSFDTAQSLMLSEHPLGTLSFSPVVVPADEVLAD